MWNIFQEVRLVGPLLCAGFLAGILCLLVINRYRNWQSRRNEIHRANINHPATDPLLVDLLRLKNYTLLFAQRWHVAASLFPLEEILVEPQLLSPPNSPDLDPLEARTDTTDWAIPYLPEWPELGSRLGSPTLTLAQALSGGCNLAITGRPGTGKSVALAWLAIQLTRNSTKVRGLEGCTALLVRHGDLDLKGDENSSLLAPLRKALQAYIAPGNNKNLEKVLLSLFESGKAIVLLDGLDEVPPSQVNPAIEYLAVLKEKYPACRMAVSASPDYLDGLFSLGFFPLALASWNWARQQEFTRKWSTAWSKLTAGQKDNASHSADQWMLQGWLSNQLTPHTPLELALRCWAAFAGDALGATPHAAVEAHLRRLTCQLAGQARPALEHLALQMVRCMQPLAQRRDAEAWLSGSHSPASSPPGDADQSAGLSHPRQQPEKRAAAAPGSLPGLLECGLLTAYHAEQVGFSHPAFLGYLAGEALLRSGESAQLLLQPEWSGKSLALERYFAQEGGSGSIAGILQNGCADILLHPLLNTARWLRHAPESAAWVKRVLSQLAASLQNESLSFSLKASLVCALALSGKASVQVLFQQMLGASRHDLRHLGILGCGMLREARTASVLQDFLSDRSPHLRSAAVLALVSIHDKASLEALANGLLNGDESLRRACAEALSNDPEEGHPALREGSTHADPAVRRAVVYGLQRIEQDWVLDTLAQVRDNDPQWVVKDAAAQALAGFEKTDPHIPRPLPAPNLAPWLIGFAAERNMVVPSGRAAVELIHCCLREGSEGQVLSAIHYLGFNGDETSVAPLYQVYLGGQGERRETAFSALQRIASTGVSLPPPAYFGMA